MIGLEDIKGLSQFLEPLILVADSVIPTAVCTNVLHMGGRFI